MHVGPWAASTGASIGSPMRACACALVTRSHGVTRPCGSRECPDPGLAEPRLALGGDAASLEGPLGLESSEGPVCLATSGFWGLPGAGGGLEDPPQAATAIAAPASARRPSR